MAIARVKHLYVAAPSAPTINLATLLGRVRQDRGVIPAEMARRLDVEPPTISGFESGKDASLKMIVGYIRELALSVGELQALNDAMAGDLTAAAYDKSLDPLERALVLDQLQRAKNGQRVMTAREKAEELGPVGLEPTTPTPRETPTLTALDGHPNPRRKRFEQTTFPLVR